MFWSEADDDDDDTSYNSATCCSRFCDVAELLTRAVFCTPRKQEGESDEENASDDDGGEGNEGGNHIFLRWVSLAFAIYKLVKFGFDFRAVVELFQNDFVTEGALLLTGMVLAWIVSSFGQSRVDSGGTCWAPFFMSPSSYYESISQRETVLRLLFTISFTEVASFLFEDGAYVNVFARSRQVLGNPNLFDQVTLWLTFVKAVASVVVLFLALLATLNCRCRGKTSRKQDDSWYTWFEETIWGSSKREKTCCGACCSHLWAVVKIMTFVAIWLVALGVIALNAFLINCLLQPDPANPDEEFGTYVPPADFIPSNWHEAVGETWYPLITSWAFALYFSILLIGRRQKEPEESSSWLSDILYQKSTSSTTSWW